MSQQKPTVGRVVHYVEEGGAHRAAIVTETYGESRAVGLYVFAPSVFFAQSSVPEDQSGEHPGTWHWPERE